MLITYTLKEHITVWKDSTNCAKRDVYCIKMKKVISDCLTIGQMNKIVVCSFNIPPYMSFSSFSVQNICKLCKSQDMHVVVLTIQPVRNKVLLILQIRNVFSAIIMVYSCKDSQNLTLICKFCP